MLAAMASRGVDEDALKSVADKALRGDRAGAVSALVSAVTVAYTGHALLGTLLGRGAEWFMNALVDRATQRVLDAERKYDEERERVDALVREIRTDLAPFWVESFEELSAQSREQFLQTLLFLDRRLDLATAGQAELSKIVREVAESVKALAGRSESAPPIDRASYARRCLERWGQFTSFSASAAECPGEPTVLERFVPQYCSIETEPQVPKRRAKARASRRGRSVLECIAEAERLVILGHAGSGKSVLLRYVLLRLLEPTRSDGLDWRTSLAGRLPILAELRDYVDSNASADGLFEAIAQVHARQGFASSAASLRAELESRPTLLLIDGLDEVVDSRLRRSMSEEIVGLLSSFPLTRVVLTSRAFGFETARFDAAGFRIVNLLEFNDEQIAQFTASSSHPEFKGELDARPELRALVRTPLLLGLIEGLLGAGELGRTRVDVYERLLNRLAYEWDDGRGVAALVREAAPRDSVVVDFVMRHHMVPILMRMAAHMRSEPERGQALSDAALQRILQKYCEAHDVRGLKAQRTADEVRDLLLVRTGVLRVSKPGTWHFAHRSLFEYLSARELADMAANGALTPQALIQEHVLPSVESGDGSEIVPLLCALLSPALAEQMLLALCPSSDEAEACSWLDHSGPIGRGVALGWQALAEIPIEKLNELDRAPAALLSSLSHDWSISGPWLDSLVSAARRLTPGPWLDAVGLAWLERPTGRWFDSLWRELVGKFGHKGSAFVRSVLERAKTGRWRDRERLAASPLAALASRGSREAFDALLRLVTQDPHPRVRASAIEALCFASDRARSFEALQRALQEDGDVLVRSKACWSLGVGFAEREQTQALLRERAVEDAHFVVRSSALEELALAYGGEPSVTTFLRMRAEADSDEYIRHSAAAAAEMSLAANPARLELSRALHAALASTRADLWSCACATYASEDDLTQRTASFAEINLRDSRAFGHAWGAVAGQMGDFQTVEEMGWADRREAGGVIALAALIEAANRARQTLQTEGSAGLKAELAPLGLPPWCDLLLELPLDFRAELEALALEACAREADFALGRPRAIAFLAALVRVLGPSEPLDIIRCTMEIDAAELLVAEPT